MGTVTPLRRLGMIATSPSLSRRRANWFNHQQCAMVNVIGAYWVGVSVANAFWLAPWIGRK